MAERPDFVIAGAARCGTTALHEYLALHPAVFMPVLKEPGFFSTDLPGGVSTLEEYRALFAPAPAHALTGEASTQYLYSKVALERLTAHNPQVRIIVILRNLVDAATVNSHVEVRSPRLEGWLRRPPALLLPLYAPLRPLCHAIGLRPGQLFTRANRGASSRQPLRPAFRAELERCFADDVAELEDLLGRRLWSERK